MQEYFKAIDEGVSYHYKLQLTDCVSSQNW